MRPLTTRVIVPVFALLALTACPDDEPARPIGAVCDASAQCASGLCYLDACLDPAGDPDLDGLTNALEATVGSDPYSADTDGDGVRDRDELGPAYEIVDTDGDGLPDAVESATDDRDSDCIPDQFDAEDDTPNFDLSPMIPVVCRDAGICAAQRDRLAAACPSGSVAVCVYDAIEGFADPEVSCDGVDQSCDGVADSGFSDLDGDGDANCVDTDLDGDGRHNFADNCPLVANAPQTDTDGDGIGDACASRYLLAITDSPERVGVDRLFQVGVTLVSLDSLAGPAGADPIAVPLPRFSGVVSLGLALNASGATLAGARSAPYDPDRASLVLTGLSLDRPAEDLRLRATSGDLTPGEAAIEVFDIFTELVALAAPGSVVADSTFNLTLVPRDETGATLRPFERALTWTSSDPAAVLPPDGVVTQTAAGTLPIASVRLRTAGPQTITITPAGAEALALVLPITVRGATAIAMSLQLEGGGDAVTAGAPFNLEVAFTDALGNPTLPTTPVSCTTTDPAATLPPAFAADAGPQPATLRTAGARTITCSAPPLNATVALAVAPADADSLAVTLSAAATAAGGSLTATVQARDAFGNDALLDAPLDVAATDPAATFAPTAPALVGGTATFAVTLFTAGAHTVTATAAPDLTGADDVTVTASSNTRLVATGAATTTAGEPWPVSLRLEDVYGNTVEASPTVVLTFADPAASVPPVTLADGVATPTLTPRTAGPWTLGAAVAAGPSTTLDVEVAPADAVSAHLTVDDLDPGSPIVTSDAQLSGVVALRDAYGNVADGPAPTLTFAATDPAAVLPAPLTFPAGAPAVAPFDGLVLRAAGDATVSVADADAALTDAVALTVAPSAPTSLELVDLPATVASGQAFGFEIVARDAAGNIATGADLALTVAFPDDLDATGPTAVTLAPSDLGRVAVAGYRLTLIGERAVTVRDAPTADGATMSVDGSIAVTPAALDHFTVSVADAEITAGVPFTVDVVARDGFGNVIADHAGPLDLTSTDPRQELPPAPAPAWEAGATSVSGLVLRTVGPQTVTVSSAAGPSASGAVDVTVIPGPGATIALEATGPLVAGEPFPLAVRVLDGEGFPRLDFVGDVTLAATDASATLPATLTFEAWNAGEITIPNVRTEVAGDLVVTATAADDPELTGSGTFDIAAADAAALELECAPATVDAGDTAACVVTARDAFGNRATSYVGEVAFAADDDASLVPAPLSLDAAAAGRATASGFGPRAVPEVEFTATSGALTAATFTFTVAPGTPSALELVDVPATTAAGDDVSFTVRIRDAFGNVDDGAFAGAVALSVTPADAAATLPPTIDFPTGASAGEASVTGALTRADAEVTLTVSADGLTGASATLEVRPGAPAALVFEDLGGPWTAGAAYPVVVGLFDAWDNRVGDDEGAFAVTLSGGVAASAPGVLTRADGDDRLRFEVEPTGVGDLTLTVSRAGGDPGALTASETVAVVAGPPSALIVRDPPGTTTAGASLALTLELRDGAGNPTTAAGALSFASTDPAFSAPAGQRTELADVGGSTFEVTLATAGEANVDVTWTPDAGGPALAISLAFLIEAGAATELMVDGLPAAVAAGAAVALDVAAIDALGNPATAFAGDLVCDTGDASDAVEPPTVALVDGAATVTVTFGAIGARTVSCVAGGLAGDAGTFVQLGDAESLTVTPLPAETIAGTARVLSVAVFDGGGNPVGDFVGRVLLTSNDDALAIPPHVDFAVEDAGVIDVPVTFTRVLEVPTTFTATLALTPGVSDATATQVTPAAASAATLEGLPGDVDAAVTQTLSLVIADAFGNLAPTDATFDVSVSDAIATAPAQVFAAVGDGGRTDFAVTFATPGAASVTLTRTDGGLTAGPATTTVREGAPASLTLNGVPTSVGGGDSFSFDATVRDGAGNPVTTWVGTIACLAFDAQDSVIADAITPAQVVFDTAPHAATATFTATLNTAGPVALSCDAGFSGASASVEVQVGAVASVVLGGLGAETVAGAGGDVTLSLFDAGGNPVSWAGTVTLASSDPADEVTPASVDLVESDEGVASFATGLRTAGAQTITATLAASGLSDSLQTTVVAAAASRLRLATRDGQPAEITAGAPLALTVHVEDAFGNPATNAGLPFSGEVALTSTQDGAAPWPAQYIPAEARRSASTALGASYDLDVTLFVAGSATVSAAATGFAATDDAVAVTVGPEQSVALTLEGLPSGATAGDVLSGSVALRDAYANLRDDLTADVTFALTTAGAAATPTPAELTLTPADRGTASFSLEVTGVGAVTLSATEQGAAGAPLTADHVVDVAVGAAETLALSGVPASLDAGGGFSFDATVRDGAGNPVTTWTGAVTCAATDADGAGIADAITPAQVVFDAPPHSGSATFSATLNAAGAVTVTCDAGFDSASATVEVQVGAVASVVLGGLGAETVAGAGGDVTLSLFDAGGNPVPWAGTITLDSSDAGDEVTPTSVDLVESDEGVATFATGLRSAGAQTITATLATSGLSDTLQTTVVAAAASRLRLVTRDGQPAEITAGAPLALTVHVEDAFGNPATNAGLPFSGEIALTSTQDGAAPWPAQYLPAEARRSASTALGASYDLDVTLFVAGSATVSAAATGFAATDDAVAVTVGPEQSVALTLEGLPSDATAGDVLSGSVALRDAYANLRDDLAADVTFTLTTTGAAATPTPAELTLTPADGGTASFSLEVTGVGAVTLSATEQGAAGAPLTADHVVDVAVGAAASVALSPLPPTTVAGDVAQVAITVYDAGGNVATGFVGAVALTSNDDTLGIPAEVQLTASDAGATSVGVTFTRVLPEATTVEATVSGSPDLVDVTSTQVLAAAARDLALSTAEPTPIAAGTVFVVDAELRDGFGNVADNPDLAFAGTIALLSDEVDPLHAPILEAFELDGSSAFASTLAQLFTAGAVELSAQVPAPSAVPGRLELTVIPGPLAALPLVAPTEPVTAGVSFELRLAPRDAWDNPITAAAGELTVLLDGGDCAPSELSGTLSGTFVADVVCATGATVDVLPFVTGADLAASSFVVEGTGSELDARDAVAPRVAEVFAPDGAALNRHDTLWVRFSEAVTPESVADNVVIEDDSGPVAGVWLPSDGAWRFAATDGALPAGAYALYVFDGVADLAGNTLAGAEIARSFSLWEELPDPMRALALPGAEVTATATLRADGRTHVLWLEVFARNEVRLWHSVRDGGEPSAPVELALAVADDHRRDVVDVRELADGGLEILWFAHDRIYLTTTSPTPGEAATTELVAVTTSPLELYDGYAPVSHHARANGDLLVVWAEDGSAPEDPALWRLAARERRDGAWGGVEVVGGAMSWVVTTGLVCAGTLCDVAWYEVGGQGDAIMVARHTGAGWQLAEPLVMGSEPWDGFAYDLGADGLRAAAWWSYNSDFEYELRGAVHGADGWGAVQVADALPGFDPANGTIDPHGVTVNVGAGKAAVSWLAYAGDGNDGDVHLVGAADLGVGLAPSVLWESSLGTVPYQSTSGAALRSARLSGDRAALVFQWQRSNQSFEATPRFVAVVLDVATGQVTVDDDDLLGSLSVGEDSAMAGNWPLEVASDGADGVLVTTAIGAAAKRVDTGGSWSAIGFPFTTYFGSGETIDYDYELQRRSASVTAHGVSWAGTQEYDSVRLISGETSATLDLASASGGGAVHWRGPGSGSQVNNFEGSAVSDGGDLAVSWRYTDRPLVGFDCAVEPELEVLGVATRDRATGLWRRPVMIDRDSSGLSCSGPGTFAGLDGHALALTADRLVVAWVAADPNFGGDPEAAVAFLDPRTGAPVADRVTTSLFGGASSFDRIALVRRGTWLFAFVGVGTDVHVLRVSDLHGAPQLESEERLSDALWDVGSGDVDAYEAGFDASVAGDLVIAARAYDADAGRYDPLWAHFDPLDSTWTAHPIAAPAGAEGYFHQSIRGFARFVPGSRVAVATSEWNDGQGAPISAVSRLDLDAGAAVTVALGPTTLSAQRVAHVRGRVVVAHADGDGAWFLSSLPALALTPAWSPPLPIGAGATPRLYAGDARATALLAWTSQDVGGDNRTTIRTLAIPVAPEDPMSFVSAPYQLSNSTGSFAVFGHPDGGWLVRSSGGLFSFWSPPVP